MTLPKEENRIRIYLDNGGYPRISRLDSYIYAKSTGVLSEAKKNGYKNEDGSCKYCDPLDPQHMMTQYGKARCVCWLIDEEEDLKESQLLASSHMPKSLQEFEIWGDIASQDSLITATDSIKKWMGDPHKWLMLTGGLGTGKSHLLQAINQYFYPWALYISILEFESLVFRTTADRTMEEALARIRTHPILLLDDIGADYGGKYSVTMLRSVIDWRYRMWDEFPVVSSTNSTPDQLRNYDARAADRLLDREISKLVLLTKVRSWRTEHEPKK